MKKILKFVVLCVSLCACSRPEPAQEIVPLPNQWLYGATKDAMDDSIIRFAGITNTDNIHDDMYYQKNHVELLIQDQKAANAPLEVTIGLTGSIFNCSGGYLSDSGSFDTDNKMCGVRIRFDGGKASTFAASQFGDSHDLLSIEDGERFMANMIKARIALIELPIYDLGRETVAFDVVGFDPKKLAQAKP